MSNTLRQYAGSKDFRGSRTILQVCGKAECASRATLCGKHCGKAAGSAGSKDFRHFLPAPGSAGRSPEKGFPPFRGEPFPRPAAPILEPAQ